MDGAKAQDVLTYLKGTNYFVSIKPVLVNDLQEWRIEAKVRKAYRSNLDFLESLRPFGSKVRGHWAPNGNRILTFF